MCFNNSTEQEKLAKNPKSSQTVVRALALIFWTLELGSSNLERYSKYTKTVDFP